MGSVPIKAWTRNVPFEDAAKQQLRNIAKMPFIHKWVAVKSRMCIWVRVPPLAV